MEFRMCIWRQEDICEEKKVNDYWESQAIQACHKNGKNDRINNNSKNT